MPRPTRPGLVPTSTQPNHRGRTHLTALLGVLLAVSSAPAQPGADASFYAPFDGTPTAQLSDGGTAEPTTARGLEFVPGIRGQAVYVGKAGEGDYDRAPALEYDGTGHFPEAGGTVSFWVRPDWDGHFTDPLQFDWYFLFTALGGKDVPDYAKTFVEPGSGYDRITLFMWNWLRCDFSQGAGEKPVLVTWSCRNAWMRGDWWHVALSWDGRGWGKLYVNGVPQCAKAQAKVADIQRFFVGGPAKTWKNTARANAAVDELRICSRALTDDEVKADFRRFAPLDFSVERRFLRADTPERLTVEITPGDGVAGRVEGRLAVRVLADADGTAVGSTATALKLSGRQTVAVPLKSLPVGDYRAECVLARAGSTFQRSFPLTVYRQREAPVPSTQDVRLGERLVSLDCTTEDNGFVASMATEVKTVPGVGSYREAGDAKWDRFGFEVKLPDGVTSPVMLEITWPDDRERAMSFYMLVKAESKQHRDRLSGGVQCGGEHPLSGKLQKTRYLFYPDGTDYLFETRTLIPGMPAAVAKLELFRVAERLPKLDIHLPGALPQRAFGHLDEDQSFEVLLGNRLESDLRQGYPVELFERLLDYLDYTGQNVLSYALLRYHWGHLDRGPINTVGSGLRTTGWVRLLLDMMEARGQRLLGNIHLYTVPEQPVVLQPSTDPLALEARMNAGYFVCDRNGKVQARQFDGQPGFGNNPAHPEVRKRFLDMIAEILHRFGSHPAFAGLDLWMDKNTPVIFNSLDVGYGDLTVRLFEKETGCRVAVAADSPTRFAERYRLLTGPLRKEWLAWRAGKTTGLLREIDGMLRRTRPDLRLYVSVGGWYSHSPGYLDKSQCEDFDFRQFAYEDLSLDLDAVRQLKSVALAPMKDLTFYRWLKHWYGGRENLTEELNWNVDKFRAFGTGARAATSMYLRYFESFSDSLKPEVYKGYFQNSDPKAHGRHFLKDFGVALASQDAAQLLVGAQPLGSMGREAEVREFTKAYRALPARDFADVPGLTDPVTARYLNTKAGTYLYVVNLLGAPVTAEIALIAGKVKTTSHLRSPAVAGLSQRSTAATVDITDLSTGGPVPLRQNSLAVDLAPYQLRSFLVSAPTARPTRGRVQVAPETQALYARQVAEVAQAVADLEVHGADATAPKERLGATERALAAGAYAEAHRLLCSKLIRGIPELREAAVKGYLKDQAAMVARGEYAVNCGSQSFYRAKSGRLFLPDRQFEPGGYGYDGGYSSVGRSIAGLKGVDDPALFATEAYDLDAYRFTVPPGTYSVRLYLKVGYLPNAKPGAFVFSVTAEGRPLLTDYDVFVASGSDFSGAAICEFDGIAVKDGVLDLQFTLPKGGGEPTARLCNAVEVLPGK